MNKSSSLVKVFYLNAIEILKNKLLINDRNDAIVKFVSYADLYNWDEDIVNAGSQVIVGNIFIDSTQFKTHQIGDMVFIMPDIGKFTINYSFEGNLVDLGKAIAEFVTIGNQTGSKFINPLFNKNLYLKLENLEGIIKFYLFTI